MTWPADVWCPKSPDRRDCSHVRSGLQIELISQPYPKAVCCCPCRTDPPEPALLTQVGQPSLNINTRRISGSTSAT